MNNKQNSTQSISVAIKWQTMQNNEYNKAGTEINQEINWMWRKGHTQTINREKLPFQKVVSVSIFSRPNWCVSFGERPICGGIVAVVYDRTKFGGSVKNTVYPIPPEVLKWRSSSWIVLWPFVQCRQCAQKFLLQDILGGLLTCWIPTIVDE